MLQSQGFVTKVYLSLDTLRFRCDRETRTAVLRLAGESPDLSFVFRESVKIFSNNAPSIDKLRKRQNGRPQRK